MRLSRRRFVWAGLVVAGGAASWEVWRIGRAPRGADVPILPDARPAALPAAAAAALVAAAGTVIGLPIEPAHYAEYYRWRAEHLPGYRALYERFVRDVDRTARAAGGRAFAESTEVVRTAVLAEAHPAPDSLEDQIRTALDGRSWLLYDRYILAEALALFARTDAWAALGYRGWPGRSRGLDRYQRPPA